MRCCFDFATSRTTELGGPCCALELQAFFSFARSVLSRSPNDVEDFQELVDRRDRSLANFARAPELMRARPARYAQSSSDGLVRLACRRKAMRSALISGTEAYHATNAVADAATATYMSIHMPDLPRPRTQRRRHCQPPRGSN